MVSSSLISFSNLLLTLVIFYLREFWASAVAMVSRRDSWVKVKWYFVAGLPFLDVFLILFEDVGVNDSFFSSVVDLFFELFGFWEEEIFEVFHVLDFEVEFFEGLF